MHQRGLMTLEIILERILFLIFKEQIELMNEEIKKLKPKTLDGFLCGYRCILDNFIPTFPTNSFVKKQIFRTPLSKEVVAEIDKKKRLYKHRKSCAKNWNRYKKQRNKVVNLLRLAKDKYCKHQIKKHSDANNIQDQIDRLQNQYSSKLHEDKKVLEVQGFSGKLLAGPADLLANFRSV